MTPSFWQAAFQVSDLAELPFTWIFPSAAMSWSGVAPSAGATASNSLSSAFSVDFRVELETPPTVVEPPLEPETG